MARTTVTWLMIEHWKWRRSIGPLRFFLLPLLLSSGAIAAVLFFIGMALVPPKTPVQAAHVGSLRASLAITETTPGDVPWVLVSVYKEIRDPRYFTTTQEIVPDLTTQTFSYAWDLSEEPCLLPNTPCKFKADMNLHAAFPLTVSASGKSEVVVSADARWTVSGLGDWLTPFIKLGVMANQGPFWGAACSPESFPGITKTVPLNSTSDLTSGTVRCPLSLVNAQDPGPGGCTLVSVSGYSDYYSNLEEIGGPWHSFSVHAHGCYAPARDKLTLQIQPADGDPDRPFTYNPYSFRLTLLKSLDSGLYEPLPNETIQLTTPLWNNLTPIFSRNFIAANCLNCATQDVNGVKVSYLQDSTQPIQLKTDANGEARIAFFLDMARLAEFDRAPTRDKALTTDFTFAYEGRTSIPVTATTSVKLNYIGIVEKIDYTQPTLFDPVTEVEVPESRRTRELIVYTHENGDPCAQDITPPACGADRVKILRGKATWFAPPEQSAYPGDTLKVGDFVVAGDEIRIDVCNLPERNRIVNGQPIGGPAEIAVQLRFFDGLRGKFIVNSTVRDVGYDFTIDPTGNLAPYVSVKTFCGSRLLVAPFIDSDNKSLQQKVKEALGLPLDTQRVVNWVTGRLMSGLVEVVFPAYKPLYSAPGRITTFVGYVQIFAGNKAAYTQVKSKIYSQAGTDYLSVTTRQGQPTLITSATGPQGIDVPAGQTAIVPESLQPQLQPTDPDTAQRADALLAQLDQSGPSATVIGDPGAASAKPIGSAAPGAPIQVVLLFALGGLLLVTTIGVVTVRLTRRTRRASPAPRATAPAAPVPTAGSIMPRQAATQQDALRPLTAAQGCLTVIRGQANAASFDLTPGVTLTIGRGPTNVVVLHDQGVSRHHARLEFVNGSWFITDLQSSNGTFVNGARVTLQALRPGDQIQIEQNVLVFQAGAPVGAAQARRTLAG